MRKILILIVASILLFAPSTFADTFKIDPVHSQIHFTVPHLMMFKVRGVFTDYSGTVEADPVKVQITSVNATIRTTSVDTREKKRDDHLRSADFFDVANHPEMTFVSTRIEGSGNNLTIHGNLTIRGNTKPVAIRGTYLGINTDPWGNVRAGFEGTTTINRLDFGLNWNKVLDTGGYVVGDQVEIGLEIQAIKQ